MKWTQSLSILFILFLLPSLPLFQMDQVIDINWLICENSLLTKSEMKDASIDQNLWFDLKPSSYFFNRVSFFFQWKNPLSVLISFFQGASSFCRPPPNLHPSLS
jgi:hypothetical protein